MIKTLLTMAASVTALAAGAQVVEVQSIEKVDMQLPLQVDASRVSPDGSFAIVSSHEDNALSRVDFATGAVTRVTDNGQTRGLSFSPDGNTVVFRRAVTAPDHRRFYSVESVELSSGYTRTLSRPARHGAAFTVTSDGALSLSDGVAFRARSIKDDAVPAAMHAVVNIHRGHLQLTRVDGTTVNLDPQGKGSYLWPSISPDGTRIVYYLSGHGCFVCNLDGSDVRPLGYVHSPVWLGNEAIVGQQDYDDGATLLSSSLVVADFNGNLQTIVPGDMYAFSPSVSADAKTITFSTFAGELYVITLR